MIPDDYLIAHVDAIVRSDRRPAYTLLWLAVTFDILAAALLFSAHLTR